MVYSLQFRVTRTEPANSNVVTQTEQIGINVVEYTGNFLVSGANLPAGGLNNTALASIANRAQIVILHKGDMSTAKDIQAEIADICGKNCTLEVSDLQMLKNGTPINGVVAGACGSSQEASVPEM